MHLDAVEHGDSIVFLHAVREGPANQSYGLQVAALAGVPKAVIQRARQRLEELEQAAQQHADQQQNQLPLLFQETPQNSVVEQALLEINPDNLTPRQALEQIYRLKTLCQT
ncbi:DNA mismatch repair protein MutS [endosymbiont of Tevnia jerichonana (vent Tica)]|uniref:DNA mismatch repair protein MutS n=1 Tax=endosymbiont of Tevnia jerichonana (vent Tica) TaxID=1049564 RepID=G2FJX8_9GAMM|nr:DNA mismatch repair protein MutS [endosymbiont of Tevnia jerichonana (vent Tica)]